MGSCEELPDGWVTTARGIRETGRRFGVSSGQRTGDKETWWWNEEVQESIQKKSLAIRNGIVRERKRVDRNTRTFMIRQRLNKGVR